VAVRAAARLIVAELLAAGFNLNLAPVLDLDLPQSIHRERCLAPAPDAVTRIARIVIDEGRKRGVLSCARHFPGLGGATQDPHFVLPRVERPRRRLLAEDIAPFADLHREVDMIMMAHGHYPAFGDIRPAPASLSSRVVGVLRRTVGFEGIIITDDLTMGAVTSLGLKPETFVRAVEAGNDMIHFSQSTPLAEAGFRAVLARAQGDAEFRHQVDRSVERILDVKRRLPPVPTRPRPSTRNRLLRQIGRLGESVAIGEPAPVP
jgi:beta-N-acetylhexosaminidase